MNPIEDRRASFAKLHESGCFVIPNPWDVGSARLLRHLGFKALATTSACRSTIASRGRRRFVGALRIFHVISYSSKRPRDY